MRKTRSDKLTIKERLLRHRKIVDGHWIWTGAQTKGGYGIMNFHDGSGSTVHRLAYKVWVNPFLPKGTAIQVHHKLPECGIRLCFNPDHLKAIRHADHVSLHHTMEETCGKGHLRSEHTTVKKDGTRYCRACRRERERLKR
jgi:hypothetical protein